MPINVLFYFTIPDVKKESCRKFAGFSFVVCIVWIGVTSYILVWMVTIIGYTFMIPDTVMGLSLVAFGSSVPDCLSSLFVAQKGRVVTESSYFCCPKYHCIFLIYYLAKLVQRWKGEFWLDPWTVRYFGIRTTKLDHSGITFGQAILKALSRSCFGGHFQQLVENARRSRWESWMLDSWAYSRSLVFWLAVLSITWHKYINTMT